MVKLGEITAYTVQEAAEILGKHPTTVRGYLRNGTLKGQKVGKSFYITDKQLAEIVTGEKQGKKL